MKTIKTSYPRIWCWVSLLKQACFGSLPVVGGTIVVIFLLFTMWLRATPSLEVRQQHKQRNHSREHGTSKRQSSTGGSQSKISIQESDTNHNNSNGNSKNGKIRNDINNNQDYSNVVRNQQYSSNMNNENIQDNIQIPPSPPDLSDIPDIPLDPYQDYWNPLLWL